MLIGLMKHYTGIFFNILLEKKQEAEVIQNNNTKLIIKQNRNRPAVENQKNKM
jgi:hypothetical protein